MSDKPTRRHNPDWKDATSATRQAARLAKLDLAAQAAGYATWRKLETAVVNGASVTVTKD
jgi:hypothetical protein